MPRTIYVAKEFSRTPGSRYITEGQFSGEEFRVRLLTPAVREAVSARTPLHIVLDGTAGFGTSFLEEAFGGLVRHGVATASDLLKLLKFESEEEIYLIGDIQDYIREAGENAKSAER